MNSAKNKKALMYTAGICGALLLLFILISWTVMPPATTVIENEIEINLGNNEEGFGEEQPLIKGERSPEATPAPPANPAPAAEESVTPDEDEDPEAAPVVKAEKKIIKAPAAPVTKPVVAPAPKPQKPKLVYDGPGKGGGNNPTTDNGYTMQGKTPGKTGDQGDPKGDKDSYGNTPGGKTGGPRVLSGNRKVVRYYSFTGDLPKATINAVIKVSPAGKGSFIRIAQGSTSFSASYATAISNYLGNIQFDKSDEESMVTVQFNFNVN